MSFSQHSVRVGLLLVVVGAVLVGVSARTEILFADGLRYIGAARALDAGDLAGGLKGSVDHPIYPTAVALAHRAIGGNGPVSWQSAAQAVSVLSAILLVVPLYLVACEVFGPGAAWLAVLLTYLSAVPTRVFADALSESTFLLFWTWALWAALRFLKQGTFAWLPLMVAFSGLAYLTRPEGLLLPVVMVLCLLAMPVLPAVRLNWPRWWAAVGFLVIGPALVAGPYLSLKGGLSAKPAVARVLGTGPKSAALAVERAKPLDPNQGVVETYVEATKEAWGALRDGIGLVLIPFAIVGVWASRPFAARGRVWLLFGVLYTVGFLGLVRLHATGGYCTPRHALLLVLPAIAAAGAGLNHLLQSVRIPARWLGMGEGRVQPGPAVWVLALAGFLALSGSQLRTPLNHNFAGYHHAGDWLAAHTTADDKVIDVTGWSQFYGQREGYTFRNLDQAPGAPPARFVVVREAHLAGPWGYCERMRQFTEGLQPVASFPPRRIANEARVLIFDRGPVLAATPGKTRQ